MPRPIVRFRCPRCGRRGTAPAAAAGRSGRCGNCSAPLNVPAAGPDEEPTARPRRGGRAGDRPVARRRPRAAAAGRFAERAAAAFAGGLVAGLVLLLVVRPYLPDGPPRGEPAAGGAAGGDPAPPPVAWARAPGEPQTLGHATVEVTGVSVGRPRVRVLALGGDREREADEVYLLVRVRVSTADPARKVDYRSWGGAFGGAAARDDAGNEYDRAGFGFGAAPVGRTAAGTAVRGRPVEDVLAFDRPVDAARWVDLTLPGSGVRQPGDFHFRIDRAAWAD